MKPAKSPLDCPTSLQQQGTEHCSMKPKAAQRDTLKQHCSHNISLHLRISKTLPRGFLKTAPQSPSTASKRPLALQPHLGGSKTPLKGLNTPPRSLKSTPEELFRRLLELPQCLHLILKKSRVSKTLLSRHPLRASRGQAAVGVARNTIV